MSRFLVRATLRDDQRIEDVVGRLRSLGLSPIIHSEDFTATSDKETRFMGRIFLVVVFWSVVGTAAGAALGVVLHVTVGPSGTEGLIIQVVSWAIFAHLIIGMCAGYLLLADRTEEDLPAVRQEGARIEVECDSIDDAREAAAILEEAGASEIVTTEAVVSSVRR
jgi:hypothetical protein